MAFSFSCRRKSTKFSFTLSLDDRMHPRNKKLYATKGLVHLGRIKQLYNLAWAFVFSGRESVVIGSLSWVVGIALFSKESTSLQIYTRGTAEEDLRGLNLNSCVVCVTGCLKDWCGWNLSWSEFQYSTALCPMNHFDLFYSWLAYRFLLVKKTVITPRKV